MTSPRSTLAFGILLMLLGVFIFAVNDVLGKWLVATYTVGQVLLIRSIAALLALAPLIARAPAGSVLKPATPGRQFLRVVVSTLEVGLFYAAVAFMPLADAMTYWLAGPIYVVVIAAVFLGEKVSALRWALVGAGFIGVVLALWPSAETLTLPALIAIVGSICFAIMTVMARSLRGTPDVTLVTWQTVGALIGGIALLPMGWVTPTPFDFALLSLLGVVALSAHMCITRAMKLAPASVLTPYTYTLIVWAVILGWLVFGDIPSWNVFAGAAIIVAAGLTLFIVETRANKPPDPVQDLV
jgi:drug/metabolite transporter (DMT)-like permease